VLEAANRVEACDMRMLGGGALSEMAQLEFDDFGFQVQEGQ
jgi:hypothetical protein